MTQAIVNTRKDIFVENCWCNRFHRCRYGVDFVWFVSFYSNGAESSILPTLTRSAHAFLSMMWLCICSVFKYFCHIGFNYLCTVITSGFNEKLPMVCEWFHFLTRKITQLIRLMWGHTRIDCRPADIFSTRFNT